MRPQQAEGNLHRMEDIMSQKTPEPFKAIVIGGSLGGLFAGSILHHIGWDVDIYERSPHDLDSRGGGIVLQPDVIKLINRVGANIYQDLGVISRERVVFELDGSVSSRNIMSETLTSWSLIYTTMRDHFGSEHYHQGKKLVDIKQLDKKVTAIFEDGANSVCDLLVGADGARSKVRNLIDQGNQPKYAGYIAWRGLVAEKDVPEESKILLERFCFANSKGSHVLGYLVPGEYNTTEKGKRYYNWVWYRTVDEKTELPDIMTDCNGKAHGYSMPPGKLADKWREHIYQEADALLPPQFKTMVKATTEPFAQAILDLVSQRMVNNRVILIGDAAFIPRPHTAASTSKAAANALALGESLANAREPDEIDEVLLEWELAQIRLGQFLYQQGTETGNYLLFHQ